MKIASSFQKANLLSMCVLTLVMLFSHAQLVPAAVISQQPHSTNVLAGSNATFTVVAGGTAPLSYRWRFNWTNLANGGRISGATNSTLLITAVVPADAGGYRVVVSNSASVVTSVVATLTVLLPPAITLQPQSLTNVLGTTASFNAAASGAPVPALHWYFNGTPLSDGGRIGGSATGTLTITNAQPGDAGNYQFVATNLAGSITSLVAQLSFYAPPTVTSQPQSQTVVVGSNVTFTVVASGSGPLQYQWQRNGTNLVDGERVSGSASTALTISNVRGTDAGGYRVVVSNAVGAVPSDPATLAVVAILGWGHNYYGQATAPAGATNVIAIDAGAEHSLALRADGTVLAWGDGSLGQTTVPAEASNVVAIAAGYHHSLALRAGGDVVAWGKNEAGESTVPADATNIVAVAGGYSHNLALRTDGSVIAWGDNLFGQTTVPDAATNVVAIAAGSDHSLALKADGTVLAWGIDQDGETDVPAGATNVVAITAGVIHSLALRADGTIVGWGSDNLFNLATPPADLTNAAAISTKLWHNLVLRRDGTLARWGDDYYGQLATPANATNCVLIAAGGDCDLVLLHDPSMGVAPDFWRQPSDRTVFGGEEVLLQTGVTGTPPLRLQWRFNDSPLEGSTNRWLWLNNLNPTQAGTYCLVASNDFGAVTSAVVTISVLSPIRILVQPTNQASRVGDSVAFTATATGTLPLYCRWQKDGQALTDNDRITGTAGSTLSIAGVRIDDAGVYRLVATNAFGTAASAEAVLAVVPIVGWGAGNSALPPLDLTNACAISAGFSDAIGLRTDGTVIAWGDENQYGQCNVPSNATNVVAIAAGWFHNIALRADGTLVGWGYNGSLGIATPPLQATNILAIAAGAFHTIYLRGDGSLGAWGNPGYGESTIPAAATNVVAIGAGGYHSLALRADGSVVAWGRNDYGESTVPSSATNVVAIAGGERHSLALRGDGTVVAWGDNSTGQSTIPAAATNIMAIAAGFNQCLAVRADGAVLAWGDNGHGQINVPATASNAVALAGGDYFSLALLAAPHLPAPQVWQQPRNSTVPIGATAILSCGVLGAQPLHYQWYYNGTALAGATQSWLALQNLSPAQAGSYYVVVTNDSGTVTSATNSLSVPPLIITTPLSGLTVPAGTNVGFSVTVASTVPVSYQWRLNQSLLAGATNLLFTLTNAQSVNAGDYDVVVTNLYGSATSSVATLTVLPAAPVITTQAASRVASVGQTVSFTAAARGTEPMTCQWQRAGIDLPGAAGFTLTLTNVNSSFNGSYRAAVSNTVGSVFSTNATLIVSPVLIWGQTNLGKQNAAIPAGATNVVAIAAGASSSTLPCLALRADGIVVAWGGWGTVPSNVVDAVAVSSGGPASQRIGNHLALLANGAVVNWSSESQLPIPVPASVTNGNNIVAVAAGGSHQLALRDDGVVIAWGSNSSGQTNVPPGATNVIAIAAGDSHSLALRADGTVVGWGLNTSGQATALSSAVNVVAIAAGGNQSLGLLADGTVVGRIVTNTPGAAVYYGPPAGNTTNKVAIAAGKYHSLAIGTDRTINGWGATNYGQITIPAYATNVLAIAAGGNDSLALVADPFAPPIPPRIGRPPLGRALEAGDNVVFNALAVGGLPLRYEWLLDGSPVAGQTNQTLTLTNAHPGEAGDYQLVAMNDFGSTTSVVATITVSIPVPILLSPGMVTNGFRFSFTGIAGVIYVVEYKDSLSTGVWTELERRFGMGGLEIVTDTSANGAMRFYRVRALYAPSPKLAAATWSGGSVNSSFATVAGAQYVVECTDQLAPPQWYELQTIVGTGSSVGFADPTPAGPQRFYRLRVR